VSWLPTVRSKQRILDFDIENRPLSYWIPDQPTAEITAIAWAWADKPSEIFLPAPGAFSTPRR